MKLLTSLTSLCALAVLTPAPAQAQCSTDGPLSLARSGSASVVLGDLLFIAGGNNFQDYYARVDVYNSVTDTWSVATPLSQARTGLSATAVGNRVLFAGGSDGAVSDVVDIYDAAMGLPSNPAAWSQTTLSLARFGASATTVGGKAIFAGGGKIGTSYKRVDIYDSAMGAPTDPAAWSHGPWLSEARASTAAVTVGDLAIFAGGSGVQGAVFDNVDIYDNFSGTWSVAQPLTVARLVGENSATVVGSRAYFAGGHNTFQGGPTMYAEVDIYDAQGSMLPPEFLPQPRGYAGVTAVGNTIFFAGGRLFGNVFTDIVDTFNVVTGQWGSTCSLSEARGTTAETLAGRAMFAGGFGVNGVSAVVDVIEPVGTNYCTSALNSTGAGATISASGTHSILANDLVLSAAGMPDQPGIFIAGSAAGQIPYLNGFLCINSNGLQRFANASFASGGVVIEAVDLATSAPGGLNALAGSSYFYQRWYRDPAAGGGNANFSDAIEVAYTP